MVAEWKEKTLGDIAEIRMCRRIFAEQTTSNGDIPFFKIGTFGKDPDAYIPRSLYIEYKDKYSFPQKGDILLSAAGTLGRTVIYDGKPAYFQDSNIVWLDIDEREVCNDYLYHCYQVMVWASPEGSTISRLYNGIIRATEIVLPPLPEQHRIASALSDTDAYIAVLEKLIAKKRAVKQGAMQELLTGKRRLPGFDGEWTEKPLGNVADVTKLAGFEFTAHIVYEDKGRIIALRGLNVKAGHLDLADVKYIDKSNFSKLTRSKLVNGDMLFTYVGTIGEVALVDVDDRYYLAPNVALIRFNEREANPLFMLYQFMSTDFQKRVISPLIASTTQSALSMANIRLFEVHIPSTYEQTAIAAVLSDMDAEIDVLSAKLNKAKHIKQGMMSELLNGRIRLIEHVEIAETIAAPKIFEIPKKKIEKKIESQKRHNEYFEDAVILGVLTAKIGSDNHPFTAFDAQKFPYLLHRHIEGVAKGYKEFAAGPYNPELKYKGARPIALKRKYVKTVKAPYFGVTADTKIQEAKKYFDRWYGAEPLQWIEQFQYIKNRRDELELLTTVDMAIVNLRNIGNQITVQAVKSYIQASEEWKAKLKRKIFSDNNITRAIKWSNSLFGGDDNAED